MRRTLLLMSTLALCAMCSLAAGEESRVREMMRKNNVRPGTPVAVEFDSSPLMQQFSVIPLKQLSVARSEMDRILAGHLLRRAGFGPTKKELKKLSKGGGNARLRWIEQQLNPDAIDDSELERILPPIDPLNGDYDYIRRWYVRMAFSKRQLQEKMTLIWHEHFSVSDEKVGTPEYMGEHEDLLRSYSLENFRDFLVDMTVNRAMLYWLDNHYNNGNAETPPNENYAREFLQLYSTGTTLLNLDGTPVLDESGNPVPAYTETDVRELSRSMTGWYVNYCPQYPDCGPALFEPAIHDDRAKFLLDAEVPAGLYAEEVGFAIDLVLAQRTDTVAAFISKELIQKLAVDNQPYESPDFFLVDQQRIHFKTLA